MTGHESSDVRTWRTRTWTWVCANVPLLFFLDVLRFEYGPSEWQYNYANKYKFARYLKRDESEIPSCLILYLIDIK